MDYQNLGWGFLDSRTLVWIAAQLHLDFAAFVLAVPLFALLIEFLGWRSRRKDYDHLAKEFIRLLPPAYGFTAITGALLGFSLFVFFPKVMNFLGKVFAPTFVVYPLLGYWLGFEIYLANPQMGITLIACSTRPRRPCPLSLATRRK
jgi:cytochrome bd-type quinol oxidase subunit 1